MGVLNGRVAIVTGGGRGIGRAICLQLAQEGAAVAVNDAGVHTDGTGHDASPAREVVDEIRASGGLAIAHSGDIAEAEAGFDLVQLAVSNFGGLDVVVNTAGILRDRMIFNLDPEDWDAVIRVHLRGTYATVRPAAAYWRQQRKPDGHRRIINFTSVSGLHGAAGQPNYAAAKMGIVGLTYSLANALAPYGVTANAISPGAATRMTQTAGSEVPADLSPDNVAPIVVYLASERSDWLTGRVLHAAGGELWLYNNPAPLAQLQSQGRWDFDELSQRVEATFRPLADGLPSSPFD